MPTQNQSTVTYGFNQAYNEKNWMPRGGTDRYNYGKESRETFSQQAWNDFFNQTMGRIATNGTTAAKNPWIGVISAPKIGNESNFAKYLQLVTQWADSNSLVSDIVMNPSTGNIQKVLGSLGGGRDFGPTVQYIDKNNGDAKRITMTMLDFNDSRRKKHKFTISRGTIEATATANGQNPQTATEIASTTTIIELTPDNNYFGELSNGCLSCKKDSCGKGYRTLYFHRNFHRGGYPQGQIMGKVQLESVIVLDAQIMPTTGNLRLEVMRSANGRTGTTTEGEFEFITTAVPLKEGDYVYVGSMTPSTQCIDFNLNCDVTQPKQYQYCVGMKTFVDCIGCVDQNILLTRRTDEILTRQQQLAYSMVSNYNETVHRTFNDFVLGEPFAYQNYPMPQHPTLPIGNEFDGELMPENVTGIIHQFDFQAKPLELEFTGCDPSCNEYILRGIINAMDFGVMDTPIDLTTPYSNGQWLLVGDTGALKGVIDARRANFMPDTRQDRIDQLDQFSYTRNVSIFSSQNTGKAADMSNEFRDMANRMGIELDEFQLGEYKIKGLYDEMLAFMEPGVMRLMFIPDIHFFTDSLDEMTQDMLGMNPYLPATAVKGKLIPSIVSQDIARVYLNGEIKDMVKNNCGFQFFSYMRAGVALSPNNASKWLKIRITGKKENPAYAGGANPLVPQYIKVPYYELGCGGCEDAYRRLRDNFQTWNGFEPVNAQPYQFGSPR